VKDGSDPNQQFNQEQMMNQQQMMMQHE